MSIKKKTALKMPKTLYVSTEEPNPDELEAFKNLRDLAVNAATDSSTIVGVYRLVRVDEYESVNVFRKVEDRPPREIKEVYCGERPNHDRGSEMVGGNPKESKP